MAAEGAGPGRRRGRRRFLFAGSSLALLAAAAALGLRKPPVDLAHTACGPADGTGRVLVAYASWTGSTAEVAAAIAQVMCVAGVPAEALPAPEVTDLGRYDAVVIGSPIHFGKWRPEAVRFLQGHREQLSRLPVAYFLTCGALRESTEEGRRLAAGYMEGVVGLAPEVRPIATGLFGGKMEYAAVPPVYIPMLLAIGSPEGDFRDWEAVRLWADDLAQGFRE